MKKEIIQKIINQEFPFQCPKRDIPILLRWIEVNKDDEFPEEEYTNLRIEYDIRTNAHFSWIIGVGEFCDFKKFRAKYRKKVERKKRWGKIYTRVFRNSKANSPTSL